MRPIDKTIKHIKLQENSLPYYFRFAQKMEGNTGQAAIKLVRSEFHQTNAYPVYPSYKPIFIC